MNADPRYDGRPLVRLLECYVLWAIGELSDRDAATLVEMTPKLQSLYGSSSTWQDIVAGTVQMDAAMPDRIRELWAKALERSSEAGERLPPQRFAEMIVDENFIGE